MQKTLDLSKEIINGNVNVSVVEMGLTINNCLEKPNIRTVFKNEFAQVGFSVVKVLVIRFMESFGFSTKMNDSQIDTLTVDTLEKFSYESLEDIVLFFKMARSGSFGATKRGVDSNLIFGEWFPMYLEKKAEIREQNYIKQKESRMQSTEGDVSKTYTEINDRIKNRQKIAKIMAHVEEITKNADRQVLEDLIIDWQKDEKRKPWVYLLKQKRKTINKAK